MSQNQSASSSYTDYSPLSWNLFFDEKKAIELNGNVFNVYLKGRSGPLFLLLHGGGHSGLTWACFTEILSESIDCQIVAPDLRGHGDTLCSNEDDLSLNTLLNDITNIYNSLFSDVQNLSVILVGHSLGGALAIHIAALKLIPNIQFLAAIDVVEGSALSSLRFMQDVLRGYPKEFPSLEKAIQWCVKSESIKNLRSVRASMPGRIKYVQNLNSESYKWRTNLQASENYWPGWFNGLSEQFLKSAVAKVLILSDVDRLDNNLLVGKMRGMFQVEVVHDVGHVIQEDSPNSVANILIGIVQRYQKFFNSTTVSKNDKKK